MSGKILPLTGLTVGGISPNVIVCGDPARATKIAETLKDASLLSDQREYRSYSGHYNDLPITVCSHGIGAPGAAIAFEELIIAGARRLVRVGTCGGLQPGIIGGDLVIAYAAVQNTGYVREVAPEGYPAVADPHLATALQRTAGKNALDTYFGLVLTRDAFFSGVQAAHIPDYKIMSEANVLAVEMECTALFTVGLLRSVSTAAILAVDGNVLDEEEGVDTYQPHRDSVTRAVDAAIQIAAQTLYEVAQEA
jgi:uridine phosphorylase